MAMNPNQMPVHDLDWAKKRILSLLDQFYEGSQRPVELMTIARLVARAFATQGFEFNAVLDHLAGELKIVCTKSKRYLVPLWAWQSMSEQERVDLSLVLEALRSKRTKAARESRPPKPELGMDKLPLTKDLMRGLNPIDVRAAVINNPNFEDANEPKPQ